MELLVEDKRQVELQEEVDSLEKLFSEYMKCHSKCQMLIVSRYDEFDNYSTESIDKRVSVITRKVMEVFEIALIKERGQVFPMASPTDQ